MPSKLCRMPGLLLHASAMRSSSIVLGYCLLAIFTLGGPVTSQEVPRPFTQTINSDVTDRSVELTRCDDIILPAASTFFRIGYDGLPVTGVPRCDATPLFVEYCDATVRCTFSQDDFRQDATGSECDTNTDSIAFSYRCLAVSDTISISELNTEVRADTLTYLRSPNYQNEPETVTNDDTTTCVLTTSSNDVFTASEFRITVSRENTGDTSDQFDVQATAESGIELSHQLTSGSRIVNYTDLIGVPLRNLNFTYSPGVEDLSFLMRLQANAQLRVCCRTVNETHPWESCDPPTPNPATGRSTEDEDEGSSSSNPETPLLLIIIPVAVAALLTLVVVAVVCVWRQRQSTATGNEKKPAVASVATPETPKPSYENIDIHTQAAESRQVATHSASVLYKNIDVNVNANMTPSNDVPVHAAENIQVTTHSAPVPYSNIDVDVINDNNTSSNKPVHPMSRDYEEVDAKRLHGQAYASLCPETCNDDYEGPYSALQTVN